MALMPESTVKPAPQHSRHRRIRARLPPMANRPWTRDELLVAFSLYCRLPFGQYHRGNPHVKRVAEALGRTPSSVAMRLSNFASLDPVHQKRGIKGLGSTGPALKAFWDEVHADWTRAAIDSELAWHRDVGSRSDALNEAPLHSETPASRDAAEAATPPTEAEGMVKTRLVQGFFRRTVLAGYACRCAICGVRPEQLLTAGHIIPWSKNETRRADPTNGLCLCALHDRAFDRGLIALDKTLRVMVSAKLEVDNPSPTQHEALLKIKGRPLTPPTRYHPDPIALKWHREQVFVG
jgi:putative restriction endonuclease